MNYAKTFSGLSGLGELNQETKTLIRNNNAAITAVLKKAKQQLNGLGNLPATSNKIKTFNEVVEEYNTGISDDEIRAWVWYKRSLGIPMKGWENYYLKGKDASEMVVTNRETQIQNNAYQPVRTVGKATVLGKYVRTQDQGARGKHYIYRGDAGLELVLAAHCDIEKSNATADKETLKTLVIAGALYYLEGELLPFPIYTYGNIYEREAQLERDKAAIMQLFGAGIYERHKKALTDAKPKTLTITNPEPKERPIIPAISDTAKKIMSKALRDEYRSDVESAEELRKVNGQAERVKRAQKINIDFDGEKSFSLQDVFVKWLFTLNADEDFKKSSAIDISQYYIKAAPLRDDKLSAQEKAEIKANARNEGEELFSRFLYEAITIEDQLALDRAWNEEFNGYSDINYKRIPVGFEISTRFKSGLLQITPIQREGIAFMQAVGSGIIAYDVGVGKTMTAIVNLANELFQGRCKRPLIVVPNPTIGKWIKELIGFRDPKTKEEVFGVLSNTGIEVNDWYNLGVDIVKANNVSKLVPEKSITIVTYEGFKKIGFSDSIIDGLLQELINILTQGPAKTPRDEEKRQQKFREMLGVGLKNTVCDIDKAGFDYLVIDEGHRCKNVFDEVASDDDGNRRYNMHGAQSETGIKAFLLTNYLQRKFGRCSMVLTATPFTNSPLEIYSMLSMVAYDYMTKNGIKNVKQFFDLFVLPTTEFVANYKEEIVEKEVIRGFNNRLVLQKLIYNHINYKTGEEAGVKRPCKISLPRVNEMVNGAIRRLPPEKQILTYLRMTERQRNNQNEIVNAARNASSKDTGAILRALGHSLDNALSPFIYSSYGEELDYKTYVTESPKIHFALECCRSVKEWHDQRGESVSGQVIYMNRGKEFFPLIREYLNKEVGYKEEIFYDTFDSKDRPKKYKLNEVEIVSSEISEERKELIKDAFLQGIVKIIIGTATIREGIDLQKYGTALYNLFPDWNPTDIKQLDGRIWRQGNTFGYVRSTMPLIQDSMDVFVFQKLDEKTSRINDIWYRGDRGNVLDLESLDPQEVKLALITDIGRLVKLFYDQAKEELSKKHRRAKNALKVIVEVKSDISRYRYYREQMLGVVKEFYEELKENEIFSKRSYAIKAEEKEHKAAQVKAKETLIQFEQFLTASNQDDKDLLSLLRKVESNDYRIYPSNTYNIGSFKEYLVKVRKTEKTYLAPKKLTIESDLGEAAKQYKADLETLEAEAKLYSTDKTGATVKAEDSIKWRELEEEVKQKKSALAVDGRTVMQRVEEYAQLNYLLGFKMEHNTGASCHIPNPNDLPAQPAKNADASAERKKQIAKFKLKALLLKL